MIPNQHPNILLSKIEIIYLRLIFLDSKFGYLQIYFVSIQLQFWHFSNCTHGKHTVLTEFNVRFFWTCVCKFFCLFLKKSKHQIISCTSKVQCQFKRNLYSIFTGQFRKFLQQSIMFSVFTVCIASCQMGLRNPGGYFLIRG